MKKVLAILIFTLSSIVFSASNVTDMSHLKLTEANEVYAYERYKIISPNFFKGKDFVYYTHEKKDMTNICYKLKIDKDFNFTMKHPDMEMKGKFTFANGIITLKGEAIFVGGAKNTTPMVLTIDPEYDVWTAGKKSPYFYNGDRYLGVNLKAADSLSYQFLFFKCEKFRACIDACL